MNNWWYITSGCHQLRFLNTNNKIETFVYNFIYSTATEFQIRDNPWTHCQLWIRMLFRYRTLYTMSLNHQHDHCIYDSHRYWPHKIRHNHNHFPFRIRRVSNKQTYHQDIWIWSSIVDDFYIHSHNMTMLLFSILLVELVRNHRNNHL